MGKHEHLQFQGQVPYGYKKTDNGLEVDPYQARILNLIMDLVLAGVDFHEVDLLMIEFEVPKLRAEREINFEELKEKMLKTAQDWRREESRSPIIKPLEL